MSQDEKLRSLERELQRSGVDGVMLPRLMHKDLVAFYAHTITRYTRKLRTLYDARAYCESGESALTERAIQTTLNKVKLFYQRMITARCYEVQDEKIKNLVNTATTAYFKELQRQPV